MNLKFLLFILSIGFLPCGAFAEVNSSQKIVTEKLVTRLTVSGYGDTEAKAYAAAQKKVPDGAKEVKVVYRPNQGGGRVLCLVTYEKP